jgi:hypothetical protein
MAGSSIRHDTPPYQAPSPSFSRNSTLRADGSILDQLGFDLRKGLLYDRQGGAFLLMTRARDRDEAIHSFSRAVDSATKCREAADYDRPAASYAFYLNQ